MGLFSKIFGTGAQGNNQPSDDGMAGNAAARICKNKGSIITAAFKAAIFATRLIDTDHEARKQAIREIKGKVYSSDEWINLSISRVMGALMPSRIEKLPLSSESELINDQYCMVTAGEAAICTTVAALIVETFGSCTDYDKLEMLNVIVSLSSGGKGCRNLRSIVPGINEKAVRAAIKAALDNSQKAIGDVVSETGFENFVRRAGINNFEHLHKDPRVAAVIFASVNAAIDSYISSLEAVS